MYVITLEEYEALGLKKLIGAIKPADAENLYGLDPKTWRRLESIHAYITDPK